MLEIIVLESNKHSLGVPAIILRDLWKELGLVKKYTDWAGSQLEIFVQGIDYIGVHFQVNPTNGVLVNDHAVSFDVAKHIALMSRTEKGREYRQRLIELEKSRQPLSYADSLRQLADEVEAKELVMKQLEVKIIQLDESKEWYSVKRVAAKTGTYWKDYDYHYLKRKSLIVGKPPQKIFDANFGEVNTYHYSVWLELYPETMMWFETD